MTSGIFETRKINIAPDAMAPDGSEVRLLGSLPRGSMAAFRLEPKAVSRAVAHRTVEEIWYFTGGTGRLWRKLGDHEEIVEVAAGVSITIPTGAHFQFRQGPVGQPPRPPGRLPQQDDHRRRVTPIVSAGPVFAVAGGG